MPALATALAAPDAKTRQNAALALERIGPAAAAAVPSPVAALDDPSEAVRHRAGEALKQINGRR